MRVYTRGPRVLGLISSGGHIFLIFFMRSILYFNANIANFVHFEKKLLDVTNEIYITPTGSHFHIVSFRMANIVFAPDFTSIYA